MTLFDGATPLLTVVRDLVSEAFVAYQNAPARIFLALPHVLAVSTSTQARIAAWPTTWHFLCPRSHALLLTFSRAGANGIDLLRCKLTAATAPCHPADDDCALCVRFKVKGTRTRVVWDGCTPPALCDGPCTAA